MIIASMSKSWDDAEPLLKEATDTLRKLHNVADLADTCPIVTLAEGNITVFLKFYGVEGAKSVAQRFANELLIANKGHPGPRLQEAVNNVLKVLSYFQTQLKTEPLPALRPLSAPAHVSVLQIS